MVENMVLAPNLENIKTAKTVPFCPVPPLSHLCCRFWA